MEIILQNKDKKKYNHIWKCLMSKLENGFKLYTTNENDANLIKNYKTLLKFVINYLERNYEFKSNIILE